MLTPATKPGRYLGIKADGLFHEKVTQDTEGAVYRAYEVKDKKTGAVTKGEKWELLYKDIKDVHITGIAFEASDYGENIVTTFSDGENEVMWSENTGSNFGSDYMKKLPNVDFSAKLTVAPYAFSADGKDKRGVTIYQNGDKVGDYFWDGKENLHGFPVPEGDTAAYTSDDWKVHFIGVKRFLTNYVKLEILPKLISVDFGNPSGQTDNDFEHPESDPTDSPAF